MKAPFKKLTLLAYHRQRQHITEMLQDLGVIHIEFNADFKNDDIEALEKEKNRLDKSIEIIEAYAVDNANHDKAKEPIDAIVKKVLSLQHRMEAIILEREALLKDKLQRLPWEDFDLIKLKGLKQWGIKVEFCVALKKEYESFDFGSLVHQVVHKSSDQVYFVVIHKSEKSIPFEKIKVPKQTLSEIIEKENQLTSESEQIHKEIGLFSAYLPKLKARHENLEDKLTFFLAQGSYNKHQKGHVLSMVGWIPAEVEDKVIKTLKEEQLSYGIDNPKADDDVPIKLKNRSYSKLFEPITKIFELPNYYEWDPTPLIAVFYPIMFAYCLGDAGYGVVFFLAALIGMFSFLKTAKKMALLGMVLGLMTTIMGLVKSGSIFGIPTNSEDWELFQALGQYVIIPDDRDFIFNAFNVALMIGVVQIFLGIFISIYNKIRYENFIKAIWQIGKLFIVTGLIWIFLADMQEIEVLQQFGILRNVLLIAGVLLVIFFHDMEQSVPARAASGFLPLFFIFTGVLGDVLSYVRLFALGVASSVLGLVVNQIGMQIMENSWWGIVIGIVFLLFGHTLNFCIAVLGSFVHPLRLTFVEFYNNAQFKGGGKEYRPFKKHYVEP
jgi:V/A-type H+-transporting ATPase subunit I